MPVNGIENKIAKRYADKYGKHDFKVTVFNVENIGKDRN